MINMHRIFALSKNELNTLPLFVRNSKIMESAGKFSNALMVQQGYELSESVQRTVESEAADVVMCVLDVLATAYPNKTVDELAILIADQLTVKCEKWASTMAQQYNNINGLNELNKQYRRAGDGK